MFDSLLQKVQPKHVPLGFVPNKKHFNPEKDDPMEAVVKVILSNVKLEDDAVWALPLSNNLHKLRMRKNQMPRGRQCRRILIRSQKSGIRRLALTEALAAMGYTYGTINLALLSSNNTSLLVDRATPPAIACFMVEVAAETARSGWGT